MCQHPGRAVKSPGNSGTYHNPTEADLRGQVPGIYEPELLPGDSDVR